MAAAAILRFRKFAYLTLVSMPAGRLLKFGKAVSSMQKLLTFFEIQDGGRRHLEFLHT